MPIDYEIRDKDRLIYARARGKVTDKEFMEYKLAQAYDERIKRPADELLEITAGAEMQLTREGITKTLQKIKELGERCSMRRNAIVVHSIEKEAWDLVKFDEAMARSHAQFNVIVFSNADVANIWLGRAQTK